jgi:hypothetical protein
MLRLVGLLSLAAVIGVTIATAGTCGVGLTVGTNTWCGLPLYWIVGFPPAIATSVVLGLPAYFIFKRYRIHSALVFALGGLLFAVPLWYFFAQPFDSPRWQQSGLFDSLNYLGSGFLGGFAFWLCVRRESKDDLTRRSSGPLRGR